VDPIEAGFDRRAMPKPIIAPPTAIEDPPPNMMLLQSSEPVAWTLFTRGAAYNAADEHR
jgi:hypothetical protein